jgi:hypothetical protein
MTINKNNFEAYLLDYLEGNLDPLLTADLMAFLTENPEFEKYIPDYDCSLSLSGTQLYTQKDQLKKEIADLPEITPGNFDEFCIASCENLLDERNFTRLSDYISLHPEKQRDLDLYRKAKLQPDTALQYSGKNRLRKNTGNAARRYLYYAVGIAASVILLFLLVFRKPAEPVYTETLPVNSGQSEYTVQPPDALPVPSDTQQNILPATDGNRQRKSPARLSQASSKVEGSPFTGFILPVLTKLEPVSVNQLLSSPQPPPVAQHLVPVNRIHQNPEQPRFYPADSFSDTRIGQLLSRIDFWKTAETAISGFNYLTESKISVDRTTDENGKLTSFLIQGESYAINGKIK